MHIGVLLHHMHRRGLQAWQRAGVQHRWLLGLLGLRCKLLLVLRKRQLLLVGHWSSCKHNDDTTQVHMVSGADCMDVGVWQCAGKHACVHCTQCQTAHQELRLVGTLVGRVVLLVRAPCLDCCCDMWVRCFCEVSLWYGAFLAIKSACRACFWSPSVWSPAEQGFLP